MYWELGIPDRGGKGEYLVYYESLVIARRVEISTPQLREGYCGIFSFYRRGVLYMEKGYPFFITYGKILGHRMTRRRNPSRWRVVLCDFRDMRIDNGA